jgi:hypothetical protein
MLPKDKILDYTFEVLEEDGKYRYVITKTINLHVFPDDRTFDSPEAAAAAAEQEIGWWREDIED